MLRNGNSELTFAVEARRGAVDDRGRPIEVLPATEPFE